MTAILEAALHYAERGWRVLPLQPRGKTPLIREYQNAATTDEDVITGWWDRWPMANVGIQMGAASGIIDIECDNEQAEARLAELFGGQMPETPTFRSKKGWHRLFRFDSSHPWAEYGNKKYPGLLPGVDFKVGGDGKGSYGVFPPSIHPDGPEYRWARDLDDGVDVAEVPGALVVAVLSLDVGNTRVGSGKDFKALASGAALTEGNRNDGIASLCGKLFAGLNDVFDDESVVVQWELIKAANAGARPPLPEKELRTTFESILRAERQRRTNEEAAVNPRRDPRTGTVARADWHLVRIESEPEMWKLYGPPWASGSRYEDGRGCYLLLTTAQLARPSAIGEAALSQASADVGPGWHTMWNGGKNRESLKSRLLVTKTTEPAPREVRRDVQVAEQLWRQLHRAVPYAEPAAGEQWRPLEKGGPCIDESGNVWANFRWLLREIATDERDDGPANRGELSAIIGKLGAPEKILRIGKGKPGFRVFSPEIMGVLEDIVSGGVELEPEPEREPAG